MSAMKKPPKVPASDLIMLMVPVPREALTFLDAPPETLSQVNVETALGIPARTYLYLLREPTCDVQVVSVGKLRIVQRVEFVEWLMKKAKRRTIEGMPDRADSIAEECGLRRRRET